MLSWRAHESGQGGGRRGPQTNANANCGSNPPTQEDLDGAVVVGVRNHKDEQDDGR